MIERLESRHLLTTNLVISEFQALNDATILDEDGDSSDWVEVHNTSPAPVDLSGFYLTDDAANLTKWKFPDVSLPAGGHLLVFASSKNRINPFEQLHANFRLSGSGEYLALVESDGLSIAFEYAPQYSSQLTDVSYGLSLDGTTVGFFPHPTPAAANVNDPVADTTQQIFISEIMYHLPSVDLLDPENVLEEYVEIYNGGALPIDLTGWSFASGINFVFPSVTLGAGDYLVVAADVPTLMAKYPAVTNVIGGWQGQLSNRGEQIELVDDSGDTVDTITYADEGDWAIRSEGPLDVGRRGWIWVADHDGGGKSLELVNLQVSNDFGQNWGRQHS